MVCAAFMKVGKSTLIGALAVAVAQGRPFLGYPTKQTGVLILALEEHPRDLQRRLQAFGLRPEDPLWVQCDPVRLSPETLRELEVFVGAHGIGLVIIDTDLCTGCKNCVDACPYKAIYFNEDLNLAQKCTGCAHLLDGGEWTVPRCADACPTEAIKFGEEEDFAEEIARAEVMKPELGAKPRVYYLNIPKKFIAGTVYDPVEKEIIEGAVCTLTGADGATYTVTTDGFGDFWFRGLADGATYSLTITAHGFAPKTFEAITTEKDVNLGDIPLAK